MWPLASLINTIGKVDLEPERGGDLSSRALGRNWIWIKIVTSKCKDRDLCWSYSDLYDWRNWKNNSMERSWDLSISEKRSQTGFEPLTSNN